jgi:hypothetical protein
MGPANTAWCHFITDRPRYYFDHPVFVNGGAFSSYNGSDLLLQTGNGYVGTTRIQVNNGTGNVVIGSGIPAQRFQVDDGNMYVRGPGNFTTNGQRAYLFMGDQYHYINVERGTGMHFGLPGVGEIVHFTYNAHVGICTSNPVSTLHVVSATNTSGMIIDHSNTSDFSFGLLVNVNRDLTKAFSINSSVTGATLFTVWGNGIVNAKKIYAEEIQVIPSAIGTYWPDYVFSPTYTLRPLSEVEKFYTANNHLPDVPSQCEVEENGMNVAQMNSILLRKVEELTLYAVQQQKEIDELRKKVEQKN